MGVNPRNPSEKVQIIHEVDRLTFEEGVEIRHGNQFEAVNLLNFQKPLLDTGYGKPVLNIPWGSFYVLKIINRFKWERDFVDKVRPIKIFLLFGLFVDTWFTLKFMFLSSFFFIMTRFVPSPNRRSRISVTLDIIKQELQGCMEVVVVDKVRVGE